MNNVVQMTARRKPRNFTKAEQVLEEIRERIHMDGRQYKKIAEATGVSASTIGNIATGHTTWPRHTTLFPLMMALGMKMIIESPDGGKK